MSKPSSFLVDLSKLIQEKKQYAENIVVGSTIQLYKTIVLKTPVDTGQLVANWQIGLNTKPTGTIAMNDPDRGSTSLAGAKAIAQWSIKDKSIWIVNNLDYAYAIEYGKSKVKAPQGMVRVSLQEFDRIFKGTAMTVNNGAGNTGNRYNKQ